jgi:hypothetical protein
MLDFIFCPLDEEVFELQLTCRPTAHCTHFFHSPAFQNHLARAISHPTLRLEIQRPWEYTMLGKSLRLLNPLSILFMITHYHDSLQIYSIYSHLFATRNHPFDHWTNFREFYLFS